MDNICSICIIDHRVAIATWKNGKLCIVDSRRINNPHTFHIIAGVGESAGLPDLLPGAILKSYDFLERIATSPVFRFKEKELKKALTQYRLNSFEELPVEVRKTVAVQISDTRPLSYFSLAHNRRIIKIIYSHKWDCLFIANVAGELYQLNLLTYCLKKITGDECREIFLRISDLTLDANEENLFFVNRNNVWQYHIRSQSLHKIWSGNQSVITKSMLVACRYHQNGIVIAEKGYVIKDGYDYQNESNFYFIDLTEKPLVAKSIYSFKFNKPLRFEMQLSVNPAPLLDSCENYFVFSFYACTVVMDQISYMKDPCTLIFIAKPAYFSALKNNPADANLYTSPYINQIKITDPIKKLLFINKGTQLCVLTQSNKLMIYDTTTLAKISEEEAVLNLAYHQNLSLCQTTKITSTPMPDEFIFSHSLSMPKTMGSLATLITKIRVLLIQELVEPPLSLKDKRTIELSLEMLENPGTIEGALFAINAVTERLPNGSSLKKATIELKQSVSSRPPETSV